MYFNKSSFLAHAACYPNCSRVPPVRHHRYYRHRYPLARPYSLLRRWQPARLRPPRRLHSKKCWCGQRGKPSRLYAPCRLYLAKSDISIWTRRREYWPTYPFEPSQVNWRTLGESWLWVQLQCTIGTRTYHEVAIRMLFGHCKLHLWAWCLSSKFWFLWWPNG